MLLYVSVLLTSLINFTVASQLPTDYDVVWSSPSQSNGSASSMPLGGGDVGLNVWAENGKGSYFHDRVDAY